MFGEKKINRFSNLPYEFLGKYNSKSQKLKELEHIDNFMSEDYISNSFKLVFSGYPTDMSTNKLITIELYNNKYDVLGIKVGMKIDNINAICVNKGFRRTKKINTNWSNYSQQSNVIGYKNGKIIICFFYENDVITEIIIDAKSSYLGICEY